MSDVIATALIAAGASIFVGSLSFIGVMVTNSRSNAKIQNEMRTAQAVSNERINELYHQIVTHEAFLRLNQLQVEVNDLMNEVNNTITCAITGEDPKTACTHNCSTCHSQCH